MHPYTYCIETPGFLRNMCTDAFRLLLSLLILLVYFLALPPLLTSSIYLVATYTCLCSFFVAKLLSLRGVV